MKTARQIASADSKPEAKSKSLLNRVVFWKRDLPEVVGVSIRTLDRWLSTGEFPAADHAVNGRPIWRRETIQKWAGLKPNA